MSGIPEPSTGVAIKLASIAAHVREAGGEDGHAFDVLAAQSLLNDPEVVEYLDVLDKLALLPRARNA